MWRSMLCGGETGAPLGLGRSAKFAPHKFAALRITMIVHLVEGRGRS
jgi:hypothetical protein